MRLKEKRSKAGLVITAIIFILLLIFNIAVFSPYNLSFRFIRYSFYPVDSDVSWLASGQLAVCDAKTEALPGDIVVWHVEDVNQIYYGTVVSSEGDGYYTVILGDSGTVTARRQAKKAVAAVKNGGRILLTLNENKVVVAAVSILILAAALYWNLHISKKRRIKKRREKYLKLFERYARQYDEYEVQYSSTADESY